MARLVEALPTEAGGKAAMEIARIMREGDRLAEGIALLERFVRRRPKASTAEHYFALGQLCLWHRATAKAIDHLCRAYALDPQRRGLAFFLGRALLDGGRALDALSRLQESRAADPNLPDIDLLLVRAHRLAGRFDEASALLSELTQKGAAGVPVLLEEAALHESRGELSRAEAVLRGLANMLAGSDIYIRRLLQFEIRHGRWTSAIATSTAWRQRAPADVEPGLWLARAHQERGALPAAEAIYRECLTADPARYEARYGLAATLRLAGRPREALAEAKALVRAAGGRIEPRLLLADLLKDLGRPDEAVALLERLAAKPDAGEAASLALVRALFHAGEQRRAAELCGRLLDASPDSPAIRSEQARLHIEAGRFAEGLSLYFGILRFNRSHAGAWRGVALGLSRMGEEGMANLVRAWTMTLRPEDPYIAAEFGQGLIRLGRPAEALVFCGELAGTWPDLPRGAEGKARALTAMGRFDEAEAVLREAEGAWPEAAQLRAARADCLTQGDRLEDAKALWTELAERLPHDPNPRFNHARLLVRERKVAAADKAYRRLVRDHPHDVGLIRRVAGHFFLKGDFAVALRLLDGLHKRAEPCESDLRIRALAALGAGRRAIAGHCLEDLAERGRVPDFVALARAVIARQDEDAAGFAAAINELYRMRGLATIRPVTFAQSRNILGMLRTDADRDPSGEAGSDPAETPRISVVMTAYNAEATIAYAVNSILRQTHRNIELIVVDDASTDRTVGIVRRLQASDARISLVCRPRNGGTYACRNVGMNLASGEIITFQDADDWSHPQRLEYQLGDLARPGVRVACTNYFRMDRFGHIDVRTPNRLVENGIAPVTAMFRRALVDEIGYFDPVVMGADSEHLDRVRLAFGGDAVFASATPFLIALRSGDTLTSNAAIGYDFLAVSPALRRYIAGYRRWHGTLMAEGLKPYLEFPLRQRPFEAPGEILGGSA